MLKSLFLWVLLVASQSASAAESTKTPRLPYLDWGACPFECCTYRDWTAEAPIKVYKNRNEKSALVFLVNKKETVQAITGVVVTHHAAPVQVLKPVKLGYRGTAESPMLSLKPKDKLYALHYAGEGNEVFWYQGKTYVDVIDETALFKRQGSPRYVWWAKIKNHAGKMGWTKQTDAFSNQDACG
jgi:hypothetical protein